MSARSVVGAGLGVGLSVVAVGVVSVWWSPWLFTVGARINGWWTA